MKAWPLFEANFLKRRWRTQESGH